MEKIWDKIDFNVVYDLYVNQGFTYKEIGYKFNCTSHVIRKIAKRHGIKSMRGTSKHRKILIQKSNLPLSLTETNLHEKIIDVPEIALQTMIGSLLGDSSLKQRINIKSRSHNVYFAQSNKQIEYLKYKRKLCEGFANEIREEREPDWTEIHDEDAFQSGLSVFSTTAHDLSYLHNLLYTEDVKGPCREYLKYLTPLSLAIWHMDDGSYNYQNRVIRIATMGFTQKANHIIRDYFYEDLRMPCFFEKVDCGYGLSIVLTQNSTKKFISLTKPYACESMLYKFP
jgi:hypothetical protein